jgi:hypothetical protein
VEILREGRESFHLMSVMAGPALAGRAGRRRRFIAAGHFSAGIALAVSPARSSCAAESGMGLAAPTLTVPQGTVTTSVKEFK